MFAIASGRVIFADIYKGYGNLVVIEHENRVTSHYAHLSVINARLGEEINAGSIIGRVGQTGLATGNHLHLEIRVEGEAVNPMDVLR